MRPLSGVRGAGKRAGSVPVTSRGQSRESRSRRIREERGVRGGGTPTLGDTKSEKGGIRDPLGPGSPVEGVPGCRHSAGCHIPLPLFSPLRRINILIDPGKMIGPAGVVISSSAKGKTLPLIPKALLFSFPNPSGFHWSGSRNKPRSRAFRLGGSGSSPATPRRRHSLGSVCGPCPR